MLNVSCLPKTLLHGLYNQRMPLSAYLILEPFKIEKGGTSKIYFLGDMSPNFDPPKPKALLGDKKGELIYVPIFH